MWRERERERNERLKKNEQSGGASVDRLRLFNPSFSTIAFPSHCNREGTNKIWWFKGGIGWGIEANIGTCKGEVTNLQERKQIRVHTEGVRLLRPWRDIAIDIDPVKTTP